MLQEPGSYVGEVVKVMGKNKVLVKVHPEGKYVVDIDKNIDITKCTPTVRVALRNDSYQVWISSLVTCGSGSCESGIGNYESDHFVALIFRAVFRKISYFTYNDRLWLILHPVGH